MLERGYPEREITALDALKSGSLAVRLSAVIWGLGCLVRRQFVKGACYLLIEAAIIFYMADAGFYNLGKLITLGDVEQQKIWNEARSLYEYVDGDRSLVILLYGIITLAVVLCGVLMIRISLRSAYAAELERRRAGRALTFRQEAAALFDANLHRTLLFLPLLGILAFTVLPLLFMTSMAFTNYSVLNDKLVLFDWVGVDNFQRMLNLSGDLGKTFWPVLGWTLCWAIIATFSNYFIGLILTLFINWKEIRGKKFWRFCFVLTVAVPHFVTLLIIRQMLQPTGAVNVLLQNMGAISSPLPFFTDTTWARTAVILINIWVGVPYVLLQMTGILQNIPPELYEAARVDGANPVVMFFKITLPYVLFVTTPYLITTFTGNINNFNVIFLTSQGLPRAVESTAGSTDLLITWLYKLTIDNRYYDVGAVIGIMTFVSLSIVSLLTFRFSGSYKDEEGFR
ncbi:MAG: sugar ABC transporter permease [Oscillospiraceae bacterium]|jgi:arabinogalactan oligomer/maltooligosaccharide transport system permease protein|nr:sugar ABC transporter permease [Oscillospiraceae bacterium]MDE6996992.1 sugar ABC transporter permease [Oscillospiraceae bacterium]